MDQIEDNPKKWVSQITNRWSKNRKLSKIGSLYAKVKAVKTIKRDQNEENLKKWATQNWT